MLHNEGDVRRNMMSYNFQTRRDDVYMLASDGDVTGNRIGPVRSSCAVHVGSYNNNRDSIYVQQQTISAEGMSGIAFSTNVPHTVRGGPPRGQDGRLLDPDGYKPGRSETKTCTDCHLSKQDDNNAVMAQLLMHGTGYVNFMGKYCWVAAVAAPCTPAPDPTRSHRPENREAKVHPLYGYLYVADKYEGLILVGVASTIDGNPLNNFLKRDVTYNPDGVLNGARAITIAGTYAYICCDAGLVVVSLADPTKPALTSVIGEPFLKEARE